jgi:predicted alpha/beta-hydrolase family hydrolase
MYRLCAALLLLAVAGCSGDNSSSLDDASTRSTTTTTGPSEDGSAGRYVEVEFVAADGEQRSGRLFGAGDVAVVLSHMGRPGDSQDDWQRFAEDHVSNSVKVLTYEGRRTLSKTWNDVVGAVEYLRDHGADVVIAGGASIGAMASLEAAIKPDSQINAVIWLAGVLNNSGYDFTETDMSGLACPMLVASGDQDGYGAADDARQLSNWTSGVSQLLILEASQHGTDILTEADPSVANQLREAMSGFIDTTANQPPATC